MAEAADPAQTADPAELVEPAEPAIGVLIVDDHRMFGESLARLLSDEEGMVVLGVANTGAEAIRMAASLRPQVVLVDFVLPDQNGVQVTTTIKRDHPDVMVVMLTGSTDDRILLAAIEAGCSGFLTKDRAATDVADAVRLAAAGDAVVSPVLLARLLKKIRPGGNTLGSDLTDREREVLALLVSGTTNKVIAAELFLSVHTIRNYVQSLLSKLGAHSKLEAVSIAVRAGIIDSSAPPV